jgi:hypothetical protein
MHGLREFIDQRRNIHALMDRAVVLDPAAEAPQRGEINIDQLRDVRPLDLDDHLAEALRLRGVGPQARPMDLAERGRRQRRGLEEFVGAFQRGAQFGSANERIAAEVLRRDPSCRPASSSVISGGRKSSRAEWNARP